MGLHYLDRNQRIGSVLFGTVSENTTSEVGVTAWQWWTAVSGVDYKDGLIFTDWKKPGDPESIITAKLLWALGNYSRSCARVCGTWNCGERGTTSAG